MGLAKALRWIEGIGGSIRLESHEKQGTRTVMLLPATNTAAANQTPQQLLKRKKA